MDSAKNIMKKTKILYIIWSLEPGGAERVVIDLAKHIDRIRFEPYVCCINQPGRLSDELVNNDISIFHLNKRGKIDFSALRRLIRIMKEKDFDIIHTHMFTANLWGRLANIFARRRPVVITEHNIDEWKNVLHFLLDRILLLYTQKVIFVSDKVRQFYEKKVNVPEEMSVVCHNGIDTSRLSIENGRDKFRVSIGVRDDALLIGSIGRLVPQKDVKNFLRAFYKVKNEKEDIIAIIVGDGPEREELVNLRDELNLSDCVKFLGMRNDIGDILNSLDLLVVSSKREGLSISILEAMSMRVPVIATNVGGNSECIIDGETGLLVPPEDPGALSQAILKGLSNKETLKDMGKKAKRLFEERFTVDKMVKLHEEIYEDIVGKITSSYPPEGAFNNSCTAEISYK